MAAHSGQREQNVKGLKKEEASQVWGSNIKLKRFDRRNWGSVPWSENWGLSELKSCCLWKSCWYFFFFLHFWATSPLERRRRGESTQSAGEDRAVEDGVENEFKITHFDPWKEKHGEGSEWRKWEWVSVRFFKVEVCWTL